MSILDKTAIVFEPIAFKNDSERLKVEEIVVCTDDVELHVGANEFFDILGLEHELLLVDLVDWVSHLDHHFVHVHIWTLAQGKVCISLIRILDFNAEGEGSEGSDDRLHFDVAFEIRADATADVKA